MIFKTLQRVTYPVTLTKKNLLINLRSEYSKDVLNEETHPTKEKTIVLYVIFHKDDAQSWCGHDQGLWR